MKIKLEVHPRGDTDKGKMEKIEFPLLVATDCFSSRSLVLRERWIDDSDPTVPSSVPYPHSCRLPIVANIERCPNEVDMRYIMDL